MFADRRDAGRRLADRVVGLRVDRPIVVGMPRGGVPVAAEVAERLGASLDIIVVRKVGSPWQPELAVGAIAEGGHKVLDPDALSDAGVGTAELDALVGREEAELSRRVERYRHGTDPLPVQGRTVVLVDDGIATGHTARAAIASLRARGASRVILAVPVAPASAIVSMRAVADDVVAVESPRWFHAVGEVYRDFTQTSDEEVVALLRAAAARAGHAGP